MTLHSIKRFHDGAAFAVALCKSQIQASLALRGAFYSSAGFMLLNDLMFFTTWWLIMSRFGSVRGWNLDDVMCLFAISSGGYGAAVVTCGGIPDLSRKIDEGELDAYLTQPKSVLLQALTCRTHISGWGDIAAALGLLALSGRVTLHNTPWLALALLCAAANFIAHAVISHSLAFWLGRIHTLARAMWEFTISFSLYPPTLFDGPIKVLLFSVLPAGLVAYLPVDVFRQPTLGSVVLLLAATAAHGSVALVMFSRGLRRYSSGTRFGTLG
jgi:viologen exporter family transport system permease protein